MTEGGERPRPRKREREMKSMARDEEILDGRDRMDPVIKDEKEKTEVRLPLIQARFNTSDKFCWRIN